MILATPSPSFEKAKHRKWIKGVDPGIIFLSHSHPHIRRGRQACLVFLNLVDIWKKDQKAHTNHLEGWSENSMTTTFICLKKILRACLQITRYAVTCLL